MIIMNIIDTVTFDGVSKDLENPYKLILIFLTGNPRV